MSNQEPPQLSDHHLAFAEFEEDYIRHYIAFADTKAGWAFTVVSAVLTYTLSQDATRESMVAPVGFIPYIAAWMSTILLLVSAWFLFTVIAPRLLRRSGEGIIFFGAVAEYESAKSYVTEVCHRSSSDIIEARLKHCFDVALVCKQKYDRLRIGLWAGLPGLLAAAVTFFA